MVNRIQNRNPGYSDNIFKNPNIEQNTINSIDGATALKLDEQLEIDALTSNISESTLGQENNESLKNNQSSSPQGISIENASYIENNLDFAKNLKNSDVNLEDTPKLFSDEDSHKMENEETQNDRLFEQNSTDEEEFEIPAFLRKQKF